MAASKNKKKRRKSKAGPRPQRPGGPGRRFRLSALDVSEGLIWLLLLTVPVLVLPITKDAFRLPKLLAAEWLGLASLLPLAWAWAWRGEPGQPLPTPRGLWRRPAVRMVSPILLVASAGWFFTSYRPVVSQSLADLWIGAVVLVGWSLGLPAARLRRLLTGLLVPGTVLAGVAVLQFHDWWRPFHFTGGEEGGRLGVTSLAGNPGDLAGFLVLAALVAQVELLCRPGRLRWLLGAVLGLLLYALVATQTVGALGALVLASLVLWTCVLSWRRLGGFVAAVVGLTLIAVLVVPPLRERAEQMGRMLSEGRVNAALSGRLDGWRGAVRMLADEPWTGVGHGAFESAYAEAKLELIDRGEKFYRGSTTVMFANAHDELLEAAAEWGLPGLLALLWAAWVLVGQARRIHRAAGDENGDENGVAVDDCALVWAGLAGLLLISLGHFPFRLAITAYPFLLLVAWILRLGEGDPALAAAGGGAESEGGSRRRRFAAGLIFLLLTGSLVLQTRRTLDRLEADRTLWRVEVITQQMAASGRVNATLLWQQIRELEEASRLDPAEAGHHLARGSQYLLLGRPEEAIEAYREALGLEPRPETYLNLGRAQNLAQQPQAAENSFRTAVKLDPYLRGQVPEEYRGRMPTREELVD
jgi:O-antigen ligase/Tfp pilus assembly protein PilF